MKIECIPKGFKSMTILIDDDPWRDIHISLFGKQPALPKGCHTIPEFAHQFSAMEHRQAKLYALKRLSMASLPSGKLIRDLRRLLVSEETAVRIVEELSKAGYLNDADYVEGFVRRQSARKMGPKAIVYKLTRQGISLNDAEAAAAYQDDDQQKESIEALLKSRYKSRDLTDTKERNKVIGALVRRGFELPLILDCILRSEP